MLRRFVRFAVEVWLQHGWMDGRRTDGRTNLLCLLLGGVPVWVLLLHFHLIFVLSSAWIWFDAKKCCLSRLAHIDRYVRLLGFVAMYWASIIYGLLQLVYNMATGVLWTVKSISVGLMCEDFLWVNIFWKPWTICLRWEDRRGTLPPVPVRMMCCCKSI